MSVAVRISEVRFAPAKAELRARGLRGWVCCLIDGRHRLDGIAVRRTDEGEYVLSYPARVDSRGRSHPFYLPDSPELREEITAQILCALRSGGWIA